jgi:ATP-dependent Clp protease ATP-binding subunit ClpA
MTSNIGSQRISEYRPVGVRLGSKKATETGVSVEEIRRDIEQELKKRLSPEFMNRIDRVVIFNPLTKENLRDIALVMLSRVHVKVEADEKALDFLVNARYDATMGARPLRRTIEDLVVDTLSDQIIGGTLSEHDTVKLGVADGRLTFTRVPAEKKEEPKEGPPEPRRPPEPPRPQAPPGRPQKRCSGKGCGALNDAAAKWCEKCGRELK